MDDLRFFAKQQGVPLADMLARFGGVSEFTASVNELRANDPQALVYAAWGYGSGTIVVRPGATAVAERAIANHGARGSIDERAALTEAQRDALALRVSLALPPDLAANTLVSVDPLGGGVNVEVPESAVSLAGSPAMDAARDEAATANLGLKVTSVPGGPEPVARGGNDYSGCTGAFVVRSGSTYGIATANHCTTKPSSYDGSSTGTTTALSGRDVRWTRFTSGTPHYTFQSNWYYYTTATGSGDPVTGSPVCKFGLHTGKSCDTVTTTGNCVTYSGYPTYCGLFKTDNTYTQPGDSGGPWYYGNTARGVTSGHNTWYNYDLFSGIGSLNLLGLTVYTY